MNIDIVKTFLKCPISRDARHKFKEYLYEKSVKDLKLIMTLLVKDEEDIIETNIRFHKAMGVDGFIVTSHNSTDKTNEILEKLKQEGIVLDIIYETNPAYDQENFVHRMIKLAKRKYKADWIINADADEFYYSRDLNLKKSILKYKKTNVNVLWVYSNFLFPDDREDFFNCPYFIKKPFLEYEAEMLGIKDKEEYKKYTGSKGCVKVIHKTKGYKKICIGNHYVRMWRKVSVEIPDITLYHYTIKNYNEQVKKLKRYIESIKGIKKGCGIHMIKMIEKYENGTLREDFDNTYSETIRNFLIEQGVISIDKSVSNFLRKIKII